MGPGKAEFSAGTHGDELEGSLWLPPKTPRWTRYSATRLPWLRADADPFGQRAKNGRSTKGRYS